MSGWTVQVTDTSGAVVSASVDIDRADPVFAGHYPGFPILPGLYLVEYVHSAVRATRGGASMRPIALDKVRFLRPVYQGDTLSIEVKLDELQGELRCLATVSVATAPVADIRLRYVRDQGRRS